MSSGESESRASVLSEALPYIRDFHGEKVVIKYGGSVMQNDELKKRVAKDIVLLQYIGLKPLVVHGGGPEIGGTLERIGIDSEFVDGLRVTDEETMDVVEMVLAGRVNKDIVNEINQAGGRAIGLSGKDGQMLLADPHSSQQELDVDLGQVGEIRSVNAEPLDLLEEKNYIPVIAPIGVNEEGVTYNMNADQVSGALASALGARKLIFLTDVVGIMIDGKLKSTLTLDEVEPLIQDGTIQGGMIPKVRACLEAVRSGVEKAHIIDGTRHHSLLLELLTQEGIGTQIIPDPDEVSASE
ncbi:MAG: acetylglutamate kinase [bacterium]